MAQEGGRDPTPRSQIERHIVVSSIQPHHGTTPKPVRMHAAMLVQHPHLHPFRPTVHRRPLQGAIACSGQTRASQLPFSKIQKQCDS